LSPVQPPFQNLYEMKETGDEEKALFAAATRNHQTQADRVIGGIGTTAADTKLRDALLSTALYVCFTCAAPVLSAHYQPREVQKWYRYQHPMMRTRPW